MNTLNQTPEDSGKKRAAIRLRVLSWLAGKINRQVIAEIERRQRKTAKPVAPAPKPLVGPDRWTPQVINNVDVGPRKTFKANIEANKAHANYQEVPQEAAEADSNLVGSLIGGTPHDYQSRHLPVLDLDYPAVLIPSSTPGHFHLLLDKEISWSQYEGFLYAATSAGLLEEGYVKASVAHGGTFIRKPGLKKVHPLDDPDFVEAQNKWKAKLGAK